MNALHSRRIIIATLFLPETPVLHDSPSPEVEPEATSDGMMSQGRTTPSQGLGAALSMTAPALESGLGSATSLMPSRDGLMVRRMSQATRPEKVRGTTSIVDDLQEKSKTATPAVVSRVSSPLRVPSLGGKGTPTSETVAHVSESLDKLTSLSMAQSDLAVSFIPNNHCNGGLRNAVHSVSDRMKRKLWIGTPGMAEAFEHKGEIERKYRSEKSSVPVWVPEGEFAAMYDEFCHQVLWPSLHYAIPDAPSGPALYESNAFKEYASVNQKFADVIVEEWKEGDIIWINDYHLLLLPLLIRAHSAWQTKHHKNPLEVPIGFFLHVAFPSSEIFRCIARRSQLLRGVLASDLVGFQTANNARHFRQTVSRILSWEASPKGIQIPDEEREGVMRGRFVDVGVFPMGIDVWGLREKKRNPEVASWVNALSARYSGMKIVVGRDKLDSIQGVRQKIQAFESFLERYPEFQQKVVLIQVALQTTESNELSGGVADTVASINAKFSTLTYQPVVFYHTQDITFSQYLALLTVADAFLVTSLREGMALRTHEFVECQEERHRPLILSEFTGSYSYSGFRSCIAVNPWDKRNTSDAIHQALTISDDEAESRWEDLHNHVITQTAQAFVTGFLTRCLRAHSEHMHLSGAAADGGPPQLNIPRIKPTWRHATKRKIFLDLEGVLWQRDTTIPGLEHFAQGVEEGTFEPPEDVTRMIQGLVGDPKNEVWLMTGLSVRRVMEKFAQVLGKQVGIIAENGCFIKPHNEETWLSRVEHLNLDWKASCIEILNYFSERTPGSYVEEREASVVWRYWTFPNPNATPLMPDGGRRDPERMSHYDVIGPDHPDRQWARRQAAEAQNHIFDSLGERYSLRIIPGSNAFLVLPNVISRASVVGAILTPGSTLQVQPKSPLRSGFATHGHHRFALDGSDAIPGVINDELILCITKDERLIRKLNDFGEIGGVNNAGEGVITVAPSVNTSTLPQRGTDAKWCLDVGNVAHIMETLIQWKT